MQSNKKQFGDIPQPMIKRHFSVPLSVDGKPIWEHAKKSEYYPDELTVVAPNRIPDIAKKIALSNESTINMGKMLDKASVTLVKLVKGEPSKVNTSKS